MKKICVLGLGKTGVSIIKEFLGSAQLYLYDDNSELLGKLCNEYKLPKFIDQDLDLLVVSPGIPNNKIKKHHIISMAEEKKILITSDIEIFQSKNPQAKYIGVTGTNGKSTTTALIGKILDVAGLKAAVCGNIGVPVLETHQADIYVIELSSYQIDLLKEIKLDIAICLNVTPDHMNCYLDMNDYTISKSRIFTDKSTNIISADYEHCKKIIDETKYNYKEISRETIISDGVSIIDDMIYINGYKYHVPYNQSLVGKYNGENVAAAVAASITIGIQVDDILRGIKEFKGLSHRMEIILHDEKKNVLYINDSKATNTISTRAAFEGLREKNIIWIVGGLCKDEGIESLHEFFSFIKKAYLIGSSTDYFYEILTSYGVLAEKSYNLENVMNTIKDCSDCTILLSPACSSTDQWKNFEERGNAFRKFVLSKS